VARDVSESSHNWRIPPEVVRIAHACNDIMPDSRICKTFNDFDELYG
jgi:hypothetical protein